MLIKSTRNFYNVDLTMAQTGAHSVAEAMLYISDFCGGFVWIECETYEGVLPKYAKFIDTFYNINVYYDFVTESFLFEEFN